MEDTFDYQMYLAKDDIFISVKSFFAQSKHTSFIRSSAMPASSNAVKNSSSLPDSGFWGLLLVLRRALSDWSST